MDQLQFYVEKRGEGLRPCEIRDLLGMTTNQCLNLYKKAKRKGFEFERLKHSSPWNVAKVKPKSKRYNCNIPDRAEVKDRAEHFPDPKKQSEYKPLDRADFYTDPVLDYIFRK